MEIKFDKLMLDRESSLTQMGQRNRLRWVCLKHLKEETFTNTTPWFRCKDYFNDAVVWFHQKQKFSIYGMSSDSFHFNEDGSMYVGISNVVSKFKDNLVLLDKIEAGMGCKVTIVGNTSENLSPDLHKGLTIDSNGVTVLHLSKECFLSTFRISMVTWLIRMANVESVYTTYTDVFKDTKEMKWVDNFLPILKSKLPVLEFDKLDEKGYLWYYNVKNNSKNMTKITSYEAGSVHNAGANQWLDAGVFN